MALFTDICNIPSFWYLLMVRRRGLTVVLWHPSHQNGTLPCGYSTYALELLGRAVVVSVVKGVCVVC